MVVLQRRAARRRRRAKRPATRRAEGDSSMTDDMIEISTPCTLLGRPPWRRPHGPPATRAGPHGGRRCALPASVRALTIRWEAALAHVQQGARRAPRAVRAAGREQQPGVRRVHATVVLELARDDEDLRPFRQREGREPSPGRELEQLDVLRVPRRVVEWQRAYRAARAG